MILYYGSKTSFQKPVFGEGNSSNDYGLGFYMTQSYELAKLWASQYNDGGYILTFEIDLDGLNVLDLKDYGEENVLRWISILVNHRFSVTARNRFLDKIAWLDKKFHINLDLVDFVIGYRADDAYFNYARAFINDELSFEILTRAMRIGELGLQYVAISKKAFDSLKFIKYEQVSHSDEYDDFRKKALNDYRDLLEEDKITNTFFRDLMRKYGE